MGRGPALAALAVIVGLLLAPAAQGRSDGAEPTRRELAIVERINEVRAENALRPLAVGPRIQEGARAYSRSLLGRDLFVHSGARGVAETLAWGVAWKMTPRRIVALWLASPPHRRWLLWPEARRIGVGLAVGKFQDVRRVRVAVAWISR